MLRGCRACRTCRATSPFSWPCAYLIGRPAVCCGVVLPVCPCVVSFSKSNEPDTHELLRGQVASIFVAHVRHARFPREMLATSSRGCNENATRKLLPFNLSLTCDMHTLIFIAEEDFVGINADRSVLAAYEGIQTTLHGAHALCKYMASSTHLSLRLNLTAHTCTTK